MNPRYATVAARALHRCEYCRAPEVIFNLSFEVEHIVPSNRGGSDDQDNLALACRACNLFKADSLTGDAGGGEPVRLFDPRKDTWPEHFSVNDATGEITGLTPVGLATINRLRLNTPTRLESRRLWRSIGLFP